jgi:hypothetical protein
MSDGLRRSAGALAAVRWFSRRGEEDRTSEEAYYLDRAKDALSAAARASDADVAEIHRELASRYFRLADASRST